MDFYQFVRFNTRLSAKLDLLFCNVKGSYICSKMPPLISDRKVESDHVMIEARPTYTPVADLPHIWKTITIKDEHAEEKMADALENTDWGLLLPEDGDLDENVEVFTTYLQNLLSQKGISKQKTVRVNGTKKWFNKECKDLRKDREMAFKRGDVLASGIIGTRFASACERAKRAYNQKLIDKFSVSSADYRMVNELLGRSQIQAMITQQAPHWLITWTMSFLSGRSQFVRFGDGKSTSLSMLSGVPQGEPISSILFNVVTYSMLFGRLWRFW